MIFCLVLCYFSQWDVPWPPGFTQTVLREGNDGSWGCTSVPPFLANNEWSACVQNMEFLLTSIDQNPFVNVILVLQPNLFIFFPVELRVCSSVWQGRFLLFHQVPVAARFVLFGWEEQMIQLWFTTSLILLFNRVPHWPLLGDYDICMGRLIW